jgi:hemerythrin
MQKNQHTEFMKKTIAFFKSAMAYEEGVPTEILVYLKTWLINHILQTDMKYKSLSNEKALK